MALVAVIDYGSGNLRSAEKAFERAARESARDDRIVVTGDPATVARADRIVLPGVGAFADCRRGFSRRFRHGRGARRGGAGARRGPSSASASACSSWRRAGSSSRPWRASAGSRARSRRSSPPIPRSRSRTWAGTSCAARARIRCSPGSTTGTHAYFVHSFGFFPARAEDVLATVDYGGAVAAAVARGNVAGVQFHPEKSQGAGLRLIANFLGWRP